MWYEFLLKPAELIGRYLTLGLGALAAGLALVLGHKRAVSKAEQAGQQAGIDQERARIERETKQITDYMERRRDTIAEQIQRDTAADDDLRQRMRAAAADSRRAD